MYRVDMLPENKWKISLHKDDFDELRNDGWHMLFQDFKYALAATACIAAIENGLLEANDRNDEWKALMDKYIVLDL